MVGLGASDGANTNDESSAEGGIGQPQFYRYCAQRVQCDCGCKPVVRVQENASGCDGVNSALEVNAKSRLANR